MTAWAVAAAWATVVSTMAIRVLRARAAVPSLPPAPPVDVSVSVVVPARNEAASIERCVRSLLSQTHPIQRVVVVDDGSSDGTGDLVRAIGDERVTVVEAPPLPEGWVGKPHACWVGSANAPPTDWLVFVDADTVSGPDLIASTLAYADEHALDLISPLPRQRIESLPERVVLPAGFFLIGLVVDLVAVNDPTRPDAGANGQCIAVRRIAYDAFGGHASVRDEILEDVAIATVAKSTGHRIMAVDAAAHIETRMYQSWPEVWGGLTKNAAAVVGGPLRAVAGGLGAIGLGLAPVAAPLLAAGGGGGPLLVAGAATVGFAALALSGARYFTAPWGWMLLIPVGIAVNGVIAIGSAWRTWRGRRMWKGRAY